jgi:glutamate racemase
VLIDSGEESARVVDILLSEGEMKGDGKRPGVVFLVTDDPERFRGVGESFFGERIDPVEKVSL